MMTHETSSQAFNQHLSQFIDKCNSEQITELYKPIAYTLDAGGKRLRPTLLLLSYSLFNGKSPLPLDVALGVELFHNFTLLHDDIMDNSLLRRNRETVHVKYNKNTAILSGDTTFALAYEKILQANNAEVNLLFTRTAKEVCEGQQLDMNFERDSNVSLENYIEMIRLKTAVLIGSSLQIGAILANATSQNAKLIYRFGIDMGIAFQIMDDYLDSFGTEKEFGKKLGQDIIDKKKTYLLITALQKASSSDKSILQKLLSSSIVSTGMVKKVIEIYKRYRIQELTKEAIQTYTEHAISGLESIEGCSESKESLRKLCYDLTSRVE